jgi:hypothetical protein
MKRFKAKKVHAPEPRAPGAVLDGDHNPSLCFVKWSKYGKPCERCTWPDDRKKGPFSLDEQASRAESMVGRKGVVRASIGNGAYVAHVPPVPGVDDDFGGGKDFKVMGEN